MELIVKDLYTMQDELDQRIFNQHQITRSETGQRRILALLVELGEFANETRCFKFWSTKGASAKEVMLEEYVDGIHFLLSIGLDLAYCPETIQSIDEKKDVNSLVLDIYGLASSFAHHASKEAYEEIFQAYVRLAYCFDFTNEDIRSSYFLKNKENFQRQDNNY